MATETDRPAKNWRRLIAWSVPALAVGCLLPAIRGVEARAAVSDAAVLLLDGDSAAVRDRLAGVSGTAARAARCIADVLDGRSAAPSGSELETLDGDAFSLPLLIRAAFSRGDFGETLRLAGLAEALGQDALPLVAAAALIEAGNADEAHDLVAAEPLPPGRLAESVVRHLRDPPPPETLVLRDRSGRRLGALAGGELELAAGVRPELVPRAAAEVASSWSRSAGSVRLSIDLELAAAAYDAFGRYYRGSIVLLDARNGEILAAVSDRRTFRAGGTAAFEQMREPASIAKLITTTAALRAGIDPDAELAKMRCRGHQSYGGELLYCPYIAGPLRGLDRALAVSCNVGFANLGVRVGWRGMVGEHRRFGFDTALGPFRGGRVVTHRGSDRRLADLSIGLEESEITPLHAALLAAVMANGGVMPSPTLVVSADGRLGFHPHPVAAAAGRRVIEPEWIPEVLGAMEVVARRGTASHLAPPGFPVAMKTGTASHPRYGFHVNYIGVGPMPEPWLAFCVRITDRPTSRKVRMAARDVSRRFLRNLARIAHRRGWVDQPPPDPRPRLAVLEDGGTSSRPSRPAALAGR
ncbi:MAG: penicillin-binding transpeptidase domain-containing protein [Thermoanaerobaculia bacterium]